MQIDNHECYLVDDGTLDTVISVNGIEFHYDTEFASQFRDETGAMTEIGFKNLCEIAIDDYEEQKAYNES